MRQLRCDHPAPDVMRIWLEAASTGNALSSSLVEEIAAALRRAEDERARILVIASTCRVFCGGFDLSERLDSDRVALQRFAAIQGVLEAMDMAPYVTVACVDGAAYGAGADLVARCDYRVCSRRARFRFPGSRFGLILGTSRLVALVGPQAARDLLLRGGVLSAEEAHACGLASDRLEPAAWEGFLLDLAAAVSELDPATLRTLLQTTRATLQSDDAALLIRSATAPGLAARITAFAGHANAR